MNQEKEFKPLSPNSFSTENLNLAAFLLAKDQPLTSWSLIDNKVSFSFTSSTNLNPLVNQFWNNDPVEVQNFLTGLNTVRNIVREATG